MIIKYGPKIPFIQFAQSLMHSIQILQIIWDFRVTLTFVGSLTFLLSRREPNHNSVAVMTKNFDVFPPARFSDHDSLSFWIHLSEMKVFPVK